MNLTISPQDTQRLVQEALINAGIGDRISKAVQDILSKGYDNPIDTAVRTYVLEVSRNLVETMFAERIKEIVIKVITEKVTEEVMEKAATEAVNKLTYRY